MRPTEDDGMRRVCGPPGAQAYSWPRPLALDVLRPAVCSENEVERLVRNVVERHRGECLHEHDTARRAESVVQAAVDHDDVAGPQRLRLVLDRPLDLALEDEHDLLRVLVLVPGHFLPRLVPDAAEQHLLAADRVDPHAVDELVGVAAVPGAERSQCLSHPWRETPRRRTTRRCGSRYTRRRRPSIPR